VRSRRSAGAAGREEHNLILTPRLPAAVAIFDVIAGCDPADPVTAASQGKRADSYLRFLDKDGARGARLGVVHQLFTSEDADPGAMARIGPQRERFSPPRASGRCRFGEGTFASTHGNGRDAPSAVIRGTASLQPVRLYEPFLVAPVGSIKRTFAPAAEVMTQTTGNGRRRDPNGASKTKELPGYARATGAGS
jgi:hypothetical protein